MSAESPNAMIFTCRGPIRAPAAARSLERTASIRWPIGLRRRLATSSPNTSTDGEAEQAEGRAWARRRASPGTLRSGPRSSPKSFGSGTGAPPPTPAPHLVLSSPKFSIATMPATVRMARLTPRTRKAGRATTTPKAVAITMAMIGPSGKPIPASTASFDTARPAMPGQTDLDQRDLTGEPGDHDERQAHERRRSAC